MTGSDQGKIPIDSPGVDPTSGEDNHISQGVIEFLQEEARYERAENIQVLVALGVVGWYITTHPEQLINLGFGREGFFFLFAVISGSFLYLKINVIAFRIAIDHQWVEKLDNSVIQFLYIFGFNGIVGTGVTGFLLDLIHINIDPHLVFGGVSTSLLLVSLAYGISYYRSTQQRSRRRQEFLEFLKNAPGSELVTFLSENPDLIEQDFTIHNTEQLLRVDGQRMRIDIYGEDAQGLSVAVEVVPILNERSADRVGEKLNKIRKNDVEFPSTIRGFDRFVIVTGSADEKTSKELQKNGIEFVNLRKLIR